MGRYTELIFGAKLKKETPQSVINTLRYMVGQIEKPDPLLYDKGRNPLTGGSGYFGVSASKPEFTFGALSETWQISTRGNIKNTDSEIEIFLDWIEPFVEVGSGALDIFAIVIDEDSNEPMLYCLR